MLIRKIRNIALGALAVCALTLGALAAESGVVTGDVVNVRSGPGTGYDRVEQLAKGKTVSILGEENGWYRVSWGDSTGYILKDYVAADSPAPNGTVTGGGNVNVRSGPGTDYSRVAQVGTGKRVALLAEEGGWFRVAFDGKTGYILGDYVAPDAGALDALLAAEAAEGSSAAEAAATESSTAAESGVITGGTVNVRAGAGTDFARVAQVSAGKTVAILGEENGWYLVSFDGKTGYVRGDYVFVGGSVPDSAVGAQVVALAWQYLGTRYVYGGSSPSGFDCSGFTSYLYRQFGYSLPHTAAGQYAGGVKVARSDLQPGDLVFFTSSGAGGRINHAALYIGNGQIIHARYSVGQVRTNSLSESYYDRNYVGAVRIA
ncbi:MAG: SH3 domain-containing protein [Oscillospiraceae bacterium]|nr:SH3 domain-containing protein [Oscillospiraceae bacterium]